MSAGRVLIIDDEPVLAEGLKYLLESEGMSVHIEQSLITLPFVFRRFDPDLVLVDLSMPALSAGAYFAARARRGAAGPPAVLYSGRPRRELARLAEELGADGCISKEEDPQDVLRRVRSLVAQGRALKAIRKEDEHGADAASAAPDRLAAAEQNRHRIA